MSAKDPILTFKPDSALVFVQQNDSTQLLVKAVFPVGYVNKYGKTKMVDGTWQYAKKGHKPTVAAPPPDKKEDDKKPDTEGLSEEQKVTLKETGILCKDDKALQYVKSNTRIFQGAIDDGKIPKYVGQDVGYIERSADNSTIQGHALEVGDAANKRKEGGVDFLEGIPKEAGDVINSYVKFHQLEDVYQEVNPYLSPFNWMVRSTVLAIAREVKKSSKEDAEKIDRLKEEYDSAFEKKKDTFKKALQLAKTSPHAPSFDLTEKDFDKSLDELKAALDSFPKTGLLPSGWFSNGDADDTVLGQVKNAMKGINEEKEENKHFGSFETFNIEEDAPKFMEARKASRSFFDMQAKLKAFIYKVKDAQGYAAHQAAQDLNDENKKWLHAAYLAEGLNALASHKGGEGAKHGHPGTIKAKDLLGEKKDLKKIYLQSLATTYKSKQQQRKLVKELSREGEEKLNISLKTVSPDVHDKVFEKMKHSFDKQSHGGFGFKIHGVYQISDAEYYKSFKKIESSDPSGNIGFSYHGTHFEAAAKIAKGGFRLGKVKTGRMLGNGLYGTETSSKALQYIGSRFNRGHGTRGVLFVCKVAKGKIHEADLNLRGNSQACDALFKQGTTDTINIGRGVAGMQNAEFCVRDPKRWLPIYWIDVELTRAGDFQKSLQLADYRSLNKRGKR